MYSHACTCMHVHTHTHTHTPMHARSHRDRHTQARACACMHSSPCARAHTHAHINMHTNVHAHKHSQEPILTNNTHTHTQHTRSLTVNRYVIFTHKCTHLHAYTRHIRRLNTACMEHNQAVRSSEHENHQGLRQPVLHVQVRTFACTFLHACT
jgi:hypothetical protein